jgi:drug/metabolite transporter (DMT)-like permease
LSVFLGLLTALSYGSGDFLGGSASRRASTVSVLLLAQVCAFVGAVAYALAFGGEGAAERDLAFGAVAGGLNVAALGCLYQGLATGRMGVVAPVTAVVAALIPIGWGLGSGERPAAIVLVGVGCAVVAAVLIARERDAGGAVGTARALQWAVAAGVGFGSSFVLYAETSDDSGFWPVLAGRATALPLVILFALVTRAAFDVARRDRGLAFAAGALDVTGTALLLLAVRRGLTSVVAPIAALAPAFTVGLAWLVEHEPIARSQVAGLALACVGLVLIAAG